MIRLEAILKKTGDCSYVPKIQADFARTVAWQRAHLNECPGLSISYPHGGLGQYVAWLRTFCRTNVAQKPTSSTSAKPQPTATKAKGPSPKPEIASKEPPPKQAKSAPKQAQSQAKGASSKPKVANNAPDTKVPGTVGTKAPSEPTPSTAAGSTPSGKTPPTSPNVTTANVGSEPPRPSSTTPASPSGPLGPVSTRFGSLAPGRIELASVPSSVNGGIHIRDAGACANMSSPCQTFSGPVTNPTSPSGTNSASGGSSSSGTSGSTSGNWNPSPVTPGAPVHPVNPWPGAPGNNVSYQQALCSNSYCGAPDPAGYIPQPA
jgi:hypothetical protein